MTMVDSKISDSLLRALHESKISRSHVLIVTTTGHQIDDPSVTRKDVRAANFLIMTAQRPLIENCGFRLWNDEITAGGSSLNFFAVHCEAENPLEAVRKLTNHAFVETVRLSGVAHALPL
jgi:hypothetical protein